MDTEPELRGPGRPPAEQAPDVRAALLAAARECIVAVGFAAASTKDIATRAGVNPAMINYYFGSKAALGEAAFRDTIEPLRQQLDALAGGAGADIQAFLPAYMATLARHPWIARIVVREVLPDNGCFREIFFEEIAGRAATLLPRAIVAAQREGFISAARDARFVAISIASMSIFPFLAEGVLRANLGVDLSDADTLAAFAEHTRTLLLRGLSEDGMTAAGGA